MAININTDINVTTGGKLTDVGQIQGAWQSVDTVADMNALTGSSTLKGLLQHGQIFYINSTSDLYILSQSGTGIFANYTFNEFVWPGTETTELNAFTGSIQAQVDSLISVTGSYAITGSNYFTDNQTIDGLLILTTQSVEPTYISGGLYLDSEYNLHIGGV